MQLAGAAAATVLFSWFHPIDRQTAQAVIEVHSLPLESRNDSEQTAELAGL